MKLFILLLFSICIYYKCANCNSTESAETEEAADAAGPDRSSPTKLPTILVATLVRNKAHTLPYFFSYLENLDYPKSRLALWLRSDHNEDNSIEIIHTWLNRTSHLYHDVDFQFEYSPSQHQNETSPFDWPKDRFSHLIRLKEEAIEKAEKLWADFIFIIDADVFLTNPNTLKHLTSLDLPIVAPMLLSEGLYSNFWAGMSSEYYYERTDEYKEIYNFKKTGYYPVPMVHSAVLINLNSAQSNMLTFDRQKLLSNQREMGISAQQLYKGPLDDIIIFAISANSSNIPMYVCNYGVFGYIVQPTEEKSIDLQQVINIKLNIVNNMDTKVLLNEEFRNFVPFVEKDKLSLDHIYMINLERRPERRHTMDLSFDELGLDVEHFAAVDGKKLDLDIIKDLGIEFLKGYEDPYHHRQMTMGEIGCFLSHFKIWEKIVELGQKEVLVLEDDIRFEPHFRQKATFILEQARKVGNWDLIYFGRKRLEDQSEPWVEGAENIVHVGYSYWTLGYVITLEGAKKLLNVEPLKKLLPVDEYLPIMFNRHPNDTWTNAFETRDLLAYSAAPLIMFPTRYTGEDGYISDTEDSDLTTEKLALESLQRNIDAIASFSEEITSSITKSEHNEL